MMTDQIDKLRTLNGELCAEINEKDRRIRELEAENAKLRESMCDVCVGVHELESLVRDIWTAYSRKSDESFHPAWDVDESLELRIAALGMEVDG